METVSPEMRVANERLWESAQAMVHALAESGSALFEPAVLAFQQDWNAFAPFVPSGYRVPGDACKAAFRGVALPIKLVEDGQYGSGTGTMLDVWVSGPKPPCRASGMPTWYAQNRNMVDAWSAPTTDNVVIEGPAPAAQTELRETETSSRADIVEAEVAVLDNRVEPTAPAPLPGDVVAEAPAQSLCEMLSGSDRGRCYDIGFRGWTKEQLRAGETVWFTPPGTPQKTRDVTVPRNMDLCAAFGPKTEARCRSQSFQNFVRNELLNGVALTLHPPALEAGAMVETAPPDVIAPSGPMPEETLELPVDVTGEAIPVLSRPQTGGVPIVAIGVGAVALGGVLWAFTRRPKRRRRRAA